jgi:hypothetical protein
VSWGPSAGACEAFPKPLHAIGFGLRLQSDVTKTAWFSTFALVIAFLGQPGAQVGPTLDDVLARLADYLTNYSASYSSTIATERYRQTYASGRTRGERALEAEFGIVRLPGTAGWVGFRDVTRVDGRQIEDREGRLARLFLAPSSASLKQADAITEESTRFNVGPIQRTVNNPTCVLVALDPRNQPRFKFSKGGEQTLNGARVWILRFTEVVRPTIIQTLSGENEPIQGRAWVDPSSGRLLRAELGLATVSMHPGVSGVDRFSATIDVSFKEDQRLQLWVPATMTERYNDNGSEIAAGDATYTNYRQFGVDTADELAK